MSQLTRAEVEALIRRGESQRRRVRELVASFQMLLQRIRRLERRLGQATTAPGDRTAAARASRAPR